MQKINFSRFFRREKASITLNNTPTIFFKESETKNPPAERRDFSFFERRPILKRNGERVSEDTKKRISNPLSFFLRTNSTNLNARFILLEPVGTLFKTSFRQRERDLFKEFRERERERLKTYKHIYKERKKERERNFGQIAPLRLRVARFGLIND